ncbi:hypothetical protein J2Z34_001940 [Youngiibacter multivorans]|uniref:Uncharacterized protein n=1 Tax=Youngiibacter multivorans TaxID=937251 RepID=A0ABS4G4I6_9CLOT|nr:hypothetical protein [Youngiibacter multivorans]
MEILEEDRLAGGSPEFDPSMKENSLNDKEFDRQ